MESHLTLNFLSALEQSAVSGNLPGFCKFPLQFALATLITLKEGQVLKQSFSHYLVKMDLYEFSLEKEARIHCHVNQPGICLLKVLEGNLVLTDKTKAYTIDVPDDCICISHEVAGDYYGRLTAGAHRMLVMSVRPEWLVNSAANFPKFEPVLQNYRTAEFPIRALPQCDIVAEMSNSFTRLQLQDGKDEIKLDLEIRQYLNKLLRRYHKLLVLERYATSTLHREKARQLFEFVNQNFNTEVVNDTAFLAKRLLVSEQTLKRLSQVAFKMPLHKYVIYFRMQRAMKLLLLTKNKIHSIANMVGYTDTYYFSRAFKKYSGVSPNEIMRPQK